MFRIMRLWEWGFDWLQPGEESGPGDYARADSASSHAPYARSPQ